MPRREGRKRCTIGVYRHVYLVDRRVWALCVLVLVLLLLKHRRTIVVFIVDLGKCKLVR
jgi:hypothetical protein